MKKVLAACVDQLLEFDSEDSFQEYIENLNFMEQWFRIISKETNGGVVVVRIQKQYDRYTFANIPKIAVLGIEKGNILKQIKYKAIKEFVKKFKEKSLPITDLFGQKRLSITKYELHMLVKETMEGSDLNEQKDAN